MKTKTALIIVDVQADFLPGGALGVTDGDQVIQPLLEAADNYDLVIASRDWHPVNHCSFKENGGIWPPHCVKQTVGADLNFNVERIADTIVSKAEKTDIDAYSAFDKTDLDEYLRERDVKKIAVGGLATDYCVKATALDALELGYNVDVIEAGVKAVNVNPEDGAKAIEVMLANGANLI